MKRRKCGRSGSCPALHDNKLHAKNTTDSLLSINTPPLSPSRSPVITSQFCSSSGSCPMPMFISCLAAPGSKALDSTRPPCSWNLASSTTTPLPPKPSAEPPRLPSPTSPIRNKRGGKKSLSCSALLQHHKSPFPPFPPDISIAFINRNRLTPIFPPHPGRLRWHVAHDVEHMKWCGSFKVCRAPSCRNTDSPGVDTSPPRPVKSGEVKKIISAEP